MRDGLYFRVLGPVSAERDGRALPLGSGQRRGVLALLLLRAGTVVSVDELAAALWGDIPPSSFRVQLQGLISELRRVLRAGDEEAPIETLPPGYRLRVPPDRLDLEEVRREVASARRHIEEGAPGPAAELLRTALAKWRGPAFAGIPYEITQQESVSLEELRLTAQEDRIEADMALGRHEELLAELTTLVQENPLRERFRGQLMSALSRAGRPADALAVYRQAREALVEELGIEPSAPLRQLHRAILMGVNRHDDAAWVRAHLVPRQLPADMPALVGRDEQLAEITALMRTGRPATVIPGVVITGPGGVGKTALAVHAAHRLRGAYPDGQLYAGLGRGGEQPTAGAVLSRFLHALGVPPGGVPRGLDERSALFRDLLADRRVLVVLDGVTDEAQLRPLLPAEPGCGLIVTSRRRLAGTAILRSVPLDVLPVELGVALLREVVGDDRVDEEPHAAAAVVRHCSGLPLAIWMAGARLAARTGWTIGDLAARLADVRNRLDWLQLGDLGVRAGVAESVSGLEDGHRLLFQRLGLLEASEFPAWLSAALIDRDAGTAERMLDDLAEVHLVEPVGRGVTGPRYQMHDLVHLVAREHAAENDDAADRHAAAGRVLHGWLGLAVAADDELPHWLGVDPEPEPAWRPPAEAAEAVKRDPQGWFDEERGALQEVVRQAAEDHPQVAWPLTQRLSTYLDLRGRYDEWADALNLGLRAAERSGDLQGQATMIGLLMQVEANRDEHLASLIYGERTLAAYRRLSPVPGEAAGQAEPAAALGRQAQHEDADPLATGFAMARRALAGRRAGEHEDYLGLFERARDAFRVGGAGLLEAWTLKHIGLVYCRQQRFADAEATLLRAREVMSDLGNSVSEAYSGGDLAGIAAALGRFDEAEAMAREALEHARADGDRWSSARALLTLGEVCRAGGDQRAALEAYLGALTLWRSLRMPARIAQVLTVLEDLSTEMGDSRAAAMYRAESTATAAPSEPASGDVS